MQRWDALESVRSRPLDLELHRRSGRRDGTLRRHGYDQSTNAYPDADADADPDAHAHSDPDANAGSWRSAGA
jgi:hypothetical protein